MHRCTGIAKSRVQTPLKSWIFFSGFLRNCINCVPNCEDHSSFDFISAALIWFISYTSFTLPVRFGTWRLLIVFKILYSFKLTCCLNRFRSCSFSSFRCGSLFCGSYGRDFFSGSHFDGFASIFCCGCFFGRFCSCRSFSSKQNLINK